jgi:hypothetical protein
MKIGETEYKSIRLRWKKKEPYTFFYLTKGIISQIAVLLQQNLL